MRTFHPRGWAMGGGRRGPDSTGLAHGNSQFHNSTIYQVHNLTILQFPTSPFPEAGQTHPAPCATGGYVKSNKAPKGHSGAKTSRLYRHGTHGTRGPMRGRLRLGGPTDPACLHRRFHIAAYRCWHQASRRPWMPVVQPEEVDQGPQVHKCALPGQPRLAWVLFIGTNRPSALPHPSFPRHANSRGWKSRVLGWGRWTVEAMGGAGFVAVPLAPHGIPSLCPETPLSTGRGPRSHIPKSGNSDPARFQN